MRAAPKSTDARGAQLDRKLEPATRASSLAQQAYDALRAGIVAGRFAPNERISEKDATESLGVSRTPVREALARLARDGFLVATHYGYRVPSITSADIANMSEVRLLLEPTAARQAAAARDAESIEELRLAIRDERAAHGAADVAAFVGGQRRFRAAWLRRVRNPILLEALGKALSTLQLLHHRTMSDAVLRAYIVESHEQLLRAIVARNADLAESIQAQRIRGFERLLQQRLFQQ